MNKNDILRLLRASSSGYISGAELAATMGASRTAVWKHVRALAREGYSIEAVPSKGYRLMASPDLIRADEIIRDSCARTIGTSIHYLRETSSTNTVADELAQQGAAEGTVVVAETQYSGKGRLGRTWISPRGNLYLSVVLRPAVPVSRAPLFTLLGAVSVASAIRCHLDLPVGIKWPNDVLLKDRKVCGLLTEMSAEPDRIRHIILGIGVNVNMDLDELPSGVRAHSTSLAAEAGRTIDRTLLLRRLLEELDRWYARVPAGEHDLLAAWRSLNVTLGREVTVRGAGQILRGHAETLDGDGRLVVRLDDGSVRQIAAGDVTIEKERR
jgi:BirA family biotin operon repressor/biotin-[acetyl-CoA-carboxylase] ligase